MTGVYILQNGRERHQKWNVSWHISICKCQQQIDKDYDPSTETSHLHDVDNIHEYEMSQKLRLYSFERGKDRLIFYEEYTQDYDKTWLLLLMGMNTELKTEAKQYFEKDFFKLMNNSLHRKSMKNIRKHRNIRFIVNEKKVSRLVLESNHYTTKWISEKLTAAEMNKTRKSRQANVSGSFYFRHHQDSAVKYYHEYAEIMQTREKYTA